MSGLIAWTSKAKRKPICKAAGKKPNPTRQRAAASRSRKLRERLAKDANKARKEAIAKAVAEKNV